MSNYKAHTVYPPGEYLSEELEDRNLTQSDFAEIIGRPLKTVNEIIKGKKSITPETANAIAAAFGTSPDIWLGLQADYDIYKLQNQKNKDKQSDVKDRAELYSLFPVRDLKKRGWIPDEKNVKKLKEDIFRLYSIRNTTVWKEGCLARFKKSGCGEINNNYINAWIELGKKIASTTKAAAFDKNGLKQFVPSIKEYSKHKDGVKKIVEKLNSIGVKLIFLPHFSKTRVDGASFWMDGSPVILMSLRYDRIDNFYFTLMHEIGHIVLHGDDDRHNFFDDMNEAGKSNDKKEKEANRYSQNNLTPLDFIAELKEQRIIHAKAIVQKSNDLKIHPGLLIGILQHEGKLTYGQYRAGLVKIKESIPKSLIHN